ncbi:MAG TPA: hypothetical protein VF200_13220 [Woeseiaceae bacterium]
MTKICLAVSGLAAWLAVPAAAHADSYQYEIDVAYDADRASTEATFESPFLNLGISSETDNDELGITGTWYFHAVGTPAGPLSRAAFIDRASGLSLSYSRGDGDSVFTVTGDGTVVAPGVTRSGQTTNAFSASLRWVWRESGWYGLGGLSRAELELAGSKTSADGYSLGFGKYLGAQTTLDLTLLRSDSDAQGAFIGGDSTSTEAALGFSHIGSVGGSWQYGTDIVLATTPRGPSDGSYSARVSLYPSRLLAFGIDVDGALRDASDASTSYGLFASWFVRERIELDARYGWLSFDESENTDADQYSFGVGVKFRF